MLFRSTVGGIKGGSGKTTVATNLACIAAGQGADVLLVDADNQETAFDFTNARKADNPGAPSYTCVKLTGSSVRTEVLAMAKKYDHIIIDAGGPDTTSQRAALSVSNDREPVRRSLPRTLRPHAAPRLDRVGQPNG